MRLSLLCPAIILVSQLSFSVSAETLVVRKVDPLTDETRIFLGTNAQEASGGEGVLYLVCEKDFLDVRISTGTHFHPEIIISAAYRFNKKPAVPKTTWMWNYKTQQASKGSPHAMPILKELISERKFYIQFESGESARFDLTSDDGYISDFVGQCSALNASFKKSFVGASELRTE